MLNLITLKEMKHQYGEKELFQMMVRRARGAQGVLDNVGAEEAREFITSPQPEIFSVDEDATSETLSELAFGILGINDGERVADLCCGSGAFLSHAARRRPGAVYRGTELDARAADAAQWRLSAVAGADAVVTAGNLFDAPEEKFDKIYCEPPFGLRFDDDRSGMAFLDGELPWIKSLRRAWHISGCWCYVFKALSMLKEGGRAVCVMLGGPLWNSFDAPVREHLVREGLVEAVVSLPGGIASYSRLEPTLLVLKRGSRTVTMADARAVAAEGRRRKRLDRGQIDRILAMLGGEGPGVRRVGADEMEAKEWQFFPGRYMQEEEAEPGESVRLGDVAAVIRGAMMGSRELEQLSGGERNYSVISYADISDGLLADELGGLSALPPRYEDCLLREGDIVMSKVGETPRCAVIRGRAAEKLVPSSNLYIIRPVRERIDPFYLKAYLESPRAKKTLVMLSTGTAIKTISATALKELRVPRMDHDKMMEISERYREAEDELRAAKMKEQEIKDKIASLFDAKE